MYLFTKPQIEQLIKNGQPEEKGKDHIPVVKLFLRGTGQLWLITEIDPENLLFAFGLYALNGKPTLGRIDIAEVMALKNEEGLPIERDTYFIAHYPISVYERAAHHFGYIVDVNSLLFAVVPRKPPDYSP